MPYPGLARVIYSHAPQNDDEAALEEEQLVFGVLAAGSEPDAEWATASGTDPADPLDGISPSLLHGMRLEKVDRAGMTLSRFVQLDPRKGIVVVETKKGLLRGMSISARDAAKVATKSIDIKNIKEVRVGLNTKELSQVERPAGEIEARAFSIIYTRRGQYKSLNLIAATKDSAEEWVSALLKLGAGSASRDPFHHDAHLRAMWNAADLDKDGQLTSGELMLLCERFNVSRTRKELAELLRSAGAVRDGPVDFEVFRRFHASLVQRPDIERLFALAGEKMDCLDLEHFRKFMIDTQKQNLSAGEIEALYALWADTNEGISKNAFASFLLSPSGGVIHPESLAVQMDMNQPLHAYWIASSHNTYLLGDQIRSSSSVEAYIRALQRGCRCVEIDTWDGPGGMPVVTHGHTLTSKVPLRDVLGAIAKYAFVATPYPLILSFEQHCSLEQQRIVAKMLVEAFGEGLLTEFPESATPEDLKYRVIVKHKRISTSANGVKTRGSRSLSPTRSMSSIASPSDGSGSPELAPSEAGTPTELSVLALISDSESDFEPMEEFVVHAGKKKKLRPTARELSDLSVLCVPNYLPPLPEGLAMARPECVTAINENMGLKLIREQWPALVAWNMLQLTRVYPRKLRIDSSNFDPQPFWDAGVQMVALNWQTKDAAMQRNRALFAGNGGAGFILKPDFLRIAPPDNMLPQPPYKTWRLKIRIISAQHLPKPSDDNASSMPTSPYVAIDVGGHQVRLMNPSERRMPAPTGASTDDDDGEAAALAAATYYTRVVQSNGFDPAWEEVCSFVFMRPETAFLRFRVWNADPRGLDSLLGCYTIHLPNMRQGYRHIPLETESGDPVPFATLFAKLRLKPYVT